MDDGGFDAIRGGAAADAAWRSRLALGVPGAAAAAVDLDAAAAAAAAALLLLDELTVDSCSWISIMWSPSLMVRFNGALPDRKSIT